MIIDQLAHAARYYAVDKGIAVALEYLQTTDLGALPAGKYAVDGDNVFAIVQEYRTMDAVNEQMESHRRHIDVQYVVTGSELIGHALQGGQRVSKEYSSEEDFMLYADEPSFFTKLDAGMFMVFYPTDLHMPCIKVGEPSMVKKVVVKVKIQ